MSNIRGVSIAAIVNEIDEGVLEAVRVLKATVSNADAKITERTTAANSLLKLKTTMFNIERTRIYDRLDIKLKTIRVQEAEIKLKALQLLSDPNAGKGEVSVSRRVLTPDMRPQGIDDKVAKELL